MWQREQEPCDQGATPDVRAVPEEEGVGGEHRLGWRKRWGTEREEVEGQAEREVRCGACVLGPWDRTVGETECQPAEILLYCGILGMPLSFPVPQFPAL